MTILLRVMSAAHEDELCMWKGFRVTAIWQKRQMDATFSPNEQPR